MLPPSGFIKNCSPGKLFAGQVYGSRFGFKKTTPGICPCHIFPAAGKDDKVPQKKGGTKANYPLHMIDGKKGLPPGSKEKRGPKKEIVPAIRADLPPCQPATVADFFKKVQKEEMSSPADPTQKSAFLPRTPDLDALILGFDGFIYICSQDYRLQYMNAKLQERTGYDATGEFCYKVLHDQEDVCPWCRND
ncbi:MAG: hypothetical protein RI601_10540, partial [Desulfurivibrionaceae bacterium]|nr:hypothetical protein [Desulfurivibrionaceae bacterium]